MIMLLFSYQQGISPLVKPMKSHFTVDVRGIDIGLYFRRLYEARAPIPGSVRDSSWTGRMIRRADEGHPDA